MDKKIEATVNVTAHFKVTVRRGLTLAQTIAEVHEAARAAAREQVARGLALAAPREHGWDAASIEASVDEITAGAVADPRRAMKVCHKARHVSDRGNVSALCYSKPRAINLSRASWTLRDEAVTCRRCRALIKAVANVNAQIGAKP